MGVFTPKRVVLFVVAVLLGTSALANHPSPRTLARMAWDTDDQVGVMFGGRGFADAATAVSHAGDETWLFSGSVWVQRFPVTKPPARSAHTMVYDSGRDRVIMFGGRQEQVDRNSSAVFLGDTWAWDGENWTRIESPESPSSRHFAGLTYDPDRDRVILFGGNAFGADGTTIEPLFDTWELDGNQWTRVATGAPTVVKPVLTYDAANDRVVMMGLNQANLTSVMYTYDGAAHTWTQVTTDKMPTCVNEGHLIYREDTQKLVFVGGLCVAGTPTSEEVFEWDGTGWVKVTTNSIPRGAGQATAFNPDRKHFVAFGGSTVLSGAIGSETLMLVGTTWRGSSLPARPRPRSLAAFASDPDTNTVWMFGGLDETGNFYLVDFWGYRNGQWFLVPHTAASPQSCESPLASYDTDRDRLVLVCSGEQTWEWDGATWKEFADLEDLPDFRRFASIAYDANLKKTVLFGGYNNNNYRNDTWLWNGTLWEEADISNRDRPDHRGMMAMWYDPLMHRTILYGGIGRSNIDRKVTRYGDMWAFDGSQWTLLEVTPTPGQKMGAQVAVHPTTGKLLLFGGLQAETIDDDSLRQFFTNDTWEWDGAASRWTKLEFPRLPDPRENGALAWDPAAGAFVLFGGYSRGFYYSDRWLFTQQGWVPLLDHAGRRRPVR